jgi:hypothetical protein
MEFAYVLPTEQRLLLVPVCSLAIRVQDPGETERCWVGLEIINPSGRLV